MIIANVIVSLQGGGALFLFVFPFYLFHFTRGETGHQRGEGTAEVHATTH